VVLLNRLTRLWHRVRYAYRSDKAQLRTLRKALAPSAMEAAVQDFEWVTMRLSAHYVREYVKDRLERVRAIPFGKAGHIAWAVADAYEAILACEDAHRVTYATLMVDEILKGRMYYDRLYTIPGVLKDPVDPITRPCGACGALAGEACRGNDNLPEALRNNAFHIGRTMEDSQ